MDDRHGNLGRGKPSSSRNIATTSTKCSRRTSSRDQRDSTHRQHPSGRSSCDNLRSSHPDERGQPPCQSSSDTAQSRHHHSAQQSVRTRDRAKSPSTDRDTSPAGSHRNRPGSRHSRHAIRKRSHHKNRHSHSHGKAPSVCSPREKASRCSPRQVRRSESVRSTITVGKRPSNARCRSSSESVCHCESCDSHSPSSKGTKAKRRKRHSRDRACQKRRSVCHVDQERASTPDLDHDLCQCKKAKTPLEPISCSRDRQPSSADSGPPVIVVQQTPAGSLLLKSVSRACVDQQPTDCREIPVNAKDLDSGVEIVFSAAKKSSRSCHDQGTDTCDDQDVESCPRGQTSNECIDLLDGAQVSFSHSMPCLPPIVPCRETGTSCELPPPCASVSRLRQEQATSTSGSRGCSRRSRSHSRSRSRSRKRSRNRPPEPSGDDIHVETAAGSVPRCELRTCATNCRSPWSPSLVCPCRCHDPDRDVPWSSWPIFGPRIAAWVQDHRRGIVERMKADYRRNKPCD